MKQKKRPRQRECERTHIVPIRVIKPLSSQFQASRSILYAMNEVEKELEKVEREIEQVERIGKMFNWFVLFLILYLIGVLIGALII